MSAAAGARDGSAELSELAMRSAVQPMLVDLITPDGPSRLVEQAIRSFACPAAAAVPGLHRQRPRRGHGMGSLAWYPLHGLVGNASSVCSSPRGRTTVTEHRA